MLNQALAGAGDKNTKLRQLAEIQEILIHREAELLDAFFDEMLQFGKDDMSTPRPAQLCSGPTVENTAGGTPSNPIHTGVTKRPIIIVHSLSRCRTPLLSNAC